jgi:hypothetical protein
MNQSSGRMSHQQVKGGFYSLEHLLAKDPDLEGKTGVNRC